MTEMIKRNAPQWGGFWMDFGRYALLSVFTDFGAWLTQIGEPGWQKINVYMVLVLASQMIVNLCLALGMMKNSSYGDAKQNGKDAAGVVASASP